MAMAMRMLMTLANGDGDGDGDAAAAAQASTCSCILRPASINVFLRNIIMMAPAALLPTASGRLILSFVQSQ